MDDYLKIACGVFGVKDFRNQPIFPLLYWGLRAQNHRGQQSYGFITYNGKFNLHRGLSLVPQIKKNAVQRWLYRLPGHVGIANVRYTTSGGTDRRSLIKGSQPAIATKGKWKLAVSFNGNVVNTKQLKDEIRCLFPSFSYDCDAELVCNKLLKELLAEGDVVSAVEKCMKEIEGAFSVAGISREGGFFFFKDPHGIRPLCAGNSEDSEVLAVSSETVGLNINQLKFAFEVAPGEFVSISQKKFLREQLVSNAKKAFCAFEFAYFARPDSLIGEKFVYEVREEFGRNLARENPDIIVDCDLVISMPETGDDAAWGVHEETGLRWERATRRHRYVTERAFMLLPRERQRTIDRKINILEKKIRGKNIIVVEDSIVRGDTTRVVVKKLRKMGAKKVFLFITFPLIRGPCFYGIDMATYGELIGSSNDQGEIARIIGADDVRYQSLYGFIRATGFKKDELCLGCLTLDYPTPKARDLAKIRKEKFEQGFEEEGRIYEGSQETQKTSI